MKEIINPKGHAVDTHVLCRQMRLLVNMGGQTRYIFCHRNVQYIRSCQLSISTIKAFNNICTPNKLNFKSFHLTIHVLHFRSIGFPSMHDIYWQLSI